MNIDFNTLVLLGIALANAWTAYMVSKTQRDVAIVKHETNSMKDALVASTDKASRAEGHATGLAEGRNETR